MLDKLDMKTKEMWKEHPKYPNYLISSKGRVQTLQYGEPQLMKLQSARGGYLSACFHVNRKNCFALVHRVVAEAFLTAPNVERKFVNHKNGNPADNRVENLEWCTHKENRLHACRVLGKGRGEGNGNNKLKLSQAKTIKALLSRKEFTHKEIATEFGVARSSVTSIDQGGTWDYIEPDHSDLGTYIESILAKRKKKKLTCKSRKLTGNQVEAIRALKGKLAQRDIAKLFKLSQATVNSILLNKIWRI